MVVAGGPEASSNFISIGSVSWLMMLTLLPNLCLFVKNVLHSVVAELNPTPSSMETGWLGFVVTCRRVSRGGVKVTDAPQASFSFQSTDGSSTLFLCEAIRMRGVFVSDGEDGSSISVSPTHRGSLEGQAQ